jgi:hypothetical protein
MGAELRCPTVRPESCARPSTNPWVARVPLPSSRVGARHDGSANAEDGDGRCIDADDEFRPSIRQKIDRLDLPAFEPWMERLEWTSKNNGHYYL